MVKYDQAGERSFYSGSTTPENADDEIIADSEMSKSGDRSPVDVERNTDSEVSNLAKRLSRQSTWSGVQSNPFDAEEGSALDPHSANFRSREWAKSMIKLQESEHFPGRTAGIAFENLNVHGYGEATDYQKSVGNVWLQLLGYSKRLVGLGKKPRRIDILRDFEGLVESGEMLVVLGPPGSGCSSFLKTITGDTLGFTVENGSYLNYQGITAHQMHKFFRGETIYTAEVDVHFPMLSVGDTLTLAAEARAPRKPPGGVSRTVWAQHLRDVFMASFGITHTMDTPVGNDFVRGVSGGERKRVTIAEACLSQSPLQCWDNSTRGLDSANAIEFVKTVRLSTELAGSAACVAIYQAPQAAYEVFDKAIVLYQGRQIFFGRTTEAQRYFEDLGFQCPDRQTTADFLTSMTSPQERERVIKPGYEHSVPRTPDEFAAIWKSSPDRKQLLGEIERYKETHPFEGEHLEKFAESRKAQQAKRQRLHSPYTMSYGQQVRLCLWRGFRRLVGDPSISLGQLIGNFIMALILGSVFYNLERTAESFFQRGAVLFFALLSNAFGSALEILTLFAQRPIVEKHSRYALYHPSAEAFASMLTDMPYKITNAIVFNTTLYFMANLRRAPGPFFYFLLVAFLTTMVMSMLFRTIASVSRTISQAMVPAGLIILSIVIFTGFAIPVEYMLGWSRWINYIDPVAYGFESLMVNEFSGQQYPCMTYTPPYGNLEQGTQVCSAVAAVAGQSAVSGTAYLESAYQYDPAHRWRNVGIVIAFTAFFLCTHLAATEFISEKKSKGEVLVFRRGYTPAFLQDGAHDEETFNATDGHPEVAEKPTGASDAIIKQTAIFSWRDVCYDIKVKKGETKRILDHVDGWVKPGTLTALVGVSGAGKTTLLDVLASRKTVGVISGNMLVDGRQRNSSFQRKTGYVQQQDLHLQTTTVREALNFSALLRQPRSIPRKEKLDYVDEVIRLLNMEEYSEAIVGVPGEGLNVEQRKRLTIGTELAAKPELLLFLDEPTSGLDSQTSWAICDLMEKLKNSGQAVLCTVHQPSAMLFQRFDRLLFLHTGGQTVYFGPIGDGSATLIDYFESHGANRCPKDANPAEWMLEVIGAAPGSHSDKDWHDIWRNSSEYREVCHELDRLADERPKVTQPIEDKDSFRPFAAPMGLQLLEVTHRVFSQYWRTPSYIYSKVALCLLSALFIGFVFFNAPLTQQGLQNQMFSIFMLFLISGQLVQQIMPLFVTQRALYEARERPSKAYSWKAFMFANIVVELPWNMLMGVIIFVCFYYPIGLYHNAEPTNSVALRGAQFFLFMIQYTLFVSTFTNMMIAGIEDAEFGGNLANIMFMLTLIFCGVLVRPESLPGFWIFMYRVSPLTYFVEGLLSAGVANQGVNCADNEYLRFRAPAGQNCGDFVQPYIQIAGGYLRSNTSMDCELCSYGDTNAFLQTVSVTYSNVWRDFGILWGYIIFNALMAVFIYWIARVPKGSRSKKKDS